MLEMMLAGGKVPDKVGNIKKITSGSATLHALTTDGVLYGRGADSNGTLGNGGVGVIGSWWKIMEGVEDIWESITFTVFKTTDNRWFWNGRLMTGGPTATIITEVTSLFTALGNTPIKKVVAGQYGLTILDTHGVVYTMGTGTNGWLFTGNTTAQTVLTKRTELTKVVEDIEMSFGTATLYLRYVDGSVVGAGASGSNQIGPAAQYTTLFEMNPASSPASDMKSGNAYFFIKRATGWYAIGTNTNGATGLNVSSGNNTSFTLVPGTTSTQKLHCTNYRTWTFEGDGSHKFTGSNPTYCGTTTPAGVWNQSSLLNLTTIPLLPSFDMKGDYAYVPSSSILMYIVKNGTVYGCGSAGANKLLPGFGTGATGAGQGFKELNMDFSYTE